MEKHSSNPVSKSIINLLRRFHLILFFVFVMAGLAVAVVMINQILTSENENSGYVSPIRAGTIDQATLNQIQALHESSAAELPQIPEGRINPFAE